MKKLAEHSALRADLPHLDRGTARAATEAKLAPPVHEVRAAAVPGTDPVLIATACHGPSADGSSVPSYRDHRGPYGASKWLQCRGQLQQLRSVAAQ